MSRLLEKFKTTSTEYPDCHLSLYYQKDGVRGFYLSLTPLRIEKNGNYQTTVTAVRDGLKMRVKDVGRFSQKAFDSFIPSKSQVDVILDHFNPKAGYTLVLD